MDAWTIITLTKRLTAARSMVAKYPKWKAEVEDLGARLGDIAQRLEKFASLKPNTKAATACYTKAQALREEVNR